MIAFDSSTAASSARNRVRSVAISASSDVPVVGCSTFIGSSSSRTGTADGDFGLKGLVARAESADMARAESFLTPRGVGNFVLLRGVPLGLEPLLRTAPVSSPGALVGTVFFFTSALGSFLAAG